jgi:phosphoglycolate phosphatase
VLAAAGVETDLDAALARFLDIYDHHLLDHTVLYPGVLDVLSALEGRAAVALLTNKPERHTERLLAAFGIRHFFFDVVGGDGRWPRKPDPSALEYLASEAGVTPASTIMVGDSMVDVETARRASARACVVRYGFGHLDDGFPPGTIVAHQPADLPPLLLAAMAP